MIPELQMLVNELKTAWNDKLEELSTEDKFTIDAWSELQNAGNRVICFEQTASMFEDRPDTKKIAIDNYTRNAQTIKKIIQRIPEFKR